jgi:hypothetical protein
MKSPIVMVFFMLVLAALACNAGADVNVSVDDQYSYLTVSLTEQQVQDVLAGALANAGRVRVENPHVDLQAGQIVVSGEAIGQDGRRYPGNMTLQAGAANGALQISIVAVNFNGFTADPDTINRWNADIAAGLGRAAAQSASEVSEVAVTDSALSITWRTPRRNSGG